MKTKYLIIGGCAGGIAGAEAIRERDSEGSLTIVSEEPYLAYSRPLIAKYLSGERTVEAMLYRPPSFYAEKNINYISGKRVQRLDLSTKTAYLDDDEPIEWQSLLLATGGKPIIPKLEGSGKRGVFNFIKLDDARAIADYLPGVKRVVVIGGGLIGISASEALRKKGVAVTVVEMKDRVLNTILDEAASSVAAAAVNAAGIDIITGHTVTTVLGDEQVSGAVLDDGRELPCEMVVIAIGVLPRTELAQQSGLNLGRGILVDERMATSQPGVYACGDAAEAFDFVYGSGRVTPIWPNAVIGGRVAGANMAGDNVRYRGGTAMNSLTYFGLDIATAGMVSPPGEADYRVYTNQNGGAYRKVIVSPEGRLSGMVLVGDTEKAGILFGLMRDQVDVSGLGKVLLADDFGLAYLPRPVWQDRLSGPTSGRVTAAREGR